MGGTGITCIRRGVEVVGMRFLVGVGHVSTGLTSAAKVRIGQPGIAFRAGVGEDIEATLHGPTVISKVVLERSASPEDKHGELLHNKTT